MKALITISILILCSLTLQAQSDFEITSPATGIVYTNGQEMIRIEYRCVQKLVGSRLELARYSARRRLIDDKFDNHGTITGTIGFLEIPASILRPGDNRLALIADRVGGISNSGANSNFIDLVYLPAYASPYIRQTDDELTWDKTWGIVHYEPTSNYEPIVYQVWVSETPDTLDATLARSWSTVTAYSFANERPGINYYYWIKALGSGKISPFHSNGYRHFTPGYLSVSTTTLLFDGAKQDTVTVNVSSDAPWSVYFPDVPPWLHILDPIGTGNGSFRIVSDPNPSLQNRTSRFEMKALINGNSSRLDITQSPGDLSILDISKSEFIINSDTATIQFGVKNVGPGNMPWYLQSDSPWLSIVSDSAGLNQGGVKIAIAPNTDGERFGKIKIMTHGAKESPQEVTIRQLRNPCLPQWRPVIATTSKILYAEVSLEGRNLRAGDILAAFRNGKCIGTGKLSLEGQKALVSVNIQGQKFDNLFFSLWDRSECQIYNSDRYSLASPFETIGNKEELIKIDFLQRVDLSLSDFTFSEEIEVSPGTLLDLTNEIENRGNIDAGQIDMTYYLSKNDTLDSTDVLVKQITLGGLKQNETQKVSSTLQVPISIVPGDYFLIARAKHPLSTDLNLDNNEVIHPMRIYLNDADCTFGDGSDGVFTGGVINLSMPNNFKRIEVKAGENITFVGDGFRAIRVQEDISIEPGVTINLRQLNGFSGETLMLGDTMINLSRDPLNYGNGGQGGRSSYSSGGFGGNSGNGQASSVTCRTPLDEEMSLGGTYPGGVGQDALPGFCEVKLEGAPWVNYHFFSAGGGATGKHGLSAEKVAFISAGSVKFEAKVVGKGSDGGRGGQGGRGNGTVSYFKGGLHRYGSQGGGGGAGGAGGHAGSIYIYSPEVADTIGLEAEFIPGIGGNGGLGGLGGGEDIFGGVDIPPKRADSGKPGNMGNHGGIYHINFKKELPRITSSKSTFLAEGDSLELNTFGGRQFDYSWYRNGEIIYNETSASLWIFEKGNYHCVLKQNSCEWPLLPITVNVRPDLTIQNLGIDSTHYLSSDILQYSFDLANDGEGFAENIAVKIYLSKDSIISDEDVLLKTLQYDALHGESCLNDSGSLDFLENTTIGNYYMLVHVIADSAYQESSLSNNVMSVPLQIYFNRIQCYEFGGESNEIFRGGILDRSQNYTFRSIILESGSTLGFSGSGSGVVNVLDDFIVKQGATIKLRNGQNFGVGQFTYDGMTANLFTEPVKNGTSGIGGTGQQGGSSNKNPRSYIQARGGAGGVVGKDGQDGYEQQNLTTGKGGLFPGGNGADGFRSQTTLGLGGGGGAGGTEGVSAENVVFVIGGVIKINGRVEGTGLDGTDGGMGGNGQTGPFCCGLAGGGGGGGAGAGGGHGGNLFFYSFLNRFDTLGVDLNTFGGRGGKGGKPGTGYSLTDGSCAVYSSNSCSFQNETPKAGIDGEDGNKGELKIFSLEPISNILIYYDTTLVLFKGDSILLKTFGGSNLDYQWYHNDTLFSSGANPSLFVSSSGNYKVKITNQSGCELVSKEYSINFEIAPTLTITTSAGSPNSGAFTATFTFSESVIGFDVADITVGNGSASNFNSTSPSVFTATITPLADGVITVDVAANKAINGAGHGNRPATQLSITNDETAPAVTITTSASSPNSGAFTATFSFSEAVTGFDADDITVVNGSASNFNSTGSSVYTATITPSADGLTTVDVRLDKAVDAASNGNTAATPLRITNDETSPAVTITTSASSPNSGAFTATFTFSESVAGFDADDVTVGNGLADNFNSISSSVYTATITPSADGLTTVDVRLDKAVDAASNGNTAATPLRITNDETSPAVTITTSASSPNSGAFTATFTFSESVAGFDADDVTVGNGLADNFNSISSSVYTATITPSADGETTIDIGADKAMDAAGNSNTAAAQLSIINDETAPAVTITTSASSPNSGVFTATFTFSEAVTGFDVTDITVSNGSVSNFKTESGSAYTATITPSADGETTIDIGADKAVDEADNSNTVAAQLSITNDETAPTVTISTSASSPNGGAFTTTFTFSEGVTGFDASDITVSNGSVSDFKIESGSVYSATITPSADGETTIDIGADKAMDAAGNSNTVAAQLSITNDETAPTVTISTSASSPNGGAFTTTFTFSEGVTGFDASDITVSNGSVSDFKIESGSVYSATITPSANGETTVDVGADKAVDEAGNSNTAAAQLSITNDETAPTVTINTSASSPNSGAFTATFTFSEPVTGFDGVDITISNGSVSNFKTTSTSVYSVTITPSADGETTVDVGADKAVDEAGNSNTVAAQLSITNDETAPTVTISTSASSPNGGVFTATFTFSEGVTGFDASDITVSNGSVSDFKIESGSVYTATITPSANGSTTIDIGADKAMDEAGNSNTAAAQLSIINDETAPTVTITTSASSPNSGAFTATFVFSEAVTGFDASDITVSNGSVSDFKIESGSAYTATITPSANGSTTIDIGADKAMDEAGNSNTAAAQLSIINDETAPTVTITTSASSPNSGAFTATFVFSEAVTGFDASDITVSNGSVSDFKTTSTSVYSATITPSANGSTTIDIGADKAMDEAGNSNTAAAQLSIINDETAPTVTITTSASSPNGGAFTTTFAFSEAVTGFDVTDITVSNGSVSNFKTESGSAYTATITPSADGETTIGVAANRAIDDADNGNSESVVLSMTIDTTAPSVPIISGITADNGISNSDANTNDNTLRFVGIAEAGSTVILFIDGTRIGTTIVDVHGDWSYDYTGTTLSDATYAVTAKTTDAAGNASSVSSELEIIIDTVLRAPELSPVDEASDILRYTALTMNFEEAVYKGTGDIVIKLKSDDSIFEAIDVTSDQVIILESTVTVEPSNPLLPNTEFYVIVEPGTLIDKAGNGFSISNGTDWAFTIMALPEIESVVVPSDQTYKIGDKLDFTVIFTRPVTIIGASTMTIDIASTIRFAELSGAVSKSSIAIFSYTIVEGDLDIDGIALGSSLSLNGGTIKDEFGTNVILTIDNIVSTSGILIDGVKPTPTITTSAGSWVKSRFTVAFEYNEPVVGFEVEDITLVNGTANNLTQIVAEKKWTVEVIPTVDGLVSVELLAAIATDGPGNKSKASNKVSTTFDGTPPIVTSITRNDWNPLNTATTSVSYRIIFSENVEGVNQADLIVDLTRSATGIVNSVIQIDAKTYDVEVNEISGEGTIGLIVKGDSSIEDIASNMLREAFKGEVYTTNFVPTDITINSSNISENNTVGDVIGTLSSTDEDATDGHSYTLTSGIGDTDNASFTIDNSSLKAAVAFDFETKKNYNIRVKTDDGRGGTKEKSLTITIDNVLEGDIVLSGDLAFGIQALGLQSSKDLTLTNNGEKAVEVRIISIPTGFAIGLSSVIIEVNQSIIAQVTFSPQEERQFSGVIVAEYESRQTSIAVSGKGDLVTKIDDVNYTEEDIHIYPNPASKNITIDLSRLNGEVVDITIHRLSGERVFLRDKVSDSSLTLDISNYGQNVYVLQIKTKTSTITKRFITM